MHSLEATSRIIVPHRRVQTAIYVVGLYSQLPICVICVAGVSRQIGEASQMPLAKCTFIIGKAFGFTAIAARSQSPQAIPRVCGNSAIGTGFAFQATSSVIAIRTGASVRTDNTAHLSKTVVCITCLQGTRISHRCQIALRIIGHGRCTAVSSSAAHKTVRRVILISCSAALRIRAARQITIVVIALFDTLPVIAQLSIGTTQRIKDGGGAKFRRANGDRNSTIELCILSG